MQMETVLWLPWNRESNCMWAYLFCNTLFSFLSHSSTIYGVCCGPSVSLSVVATRFWYCCWLLLTKIPFHIRWEAFLASSMVQMFLLLAVRMSTLRVWWQQGQVQSQMQTQVFQLTPLSADKGTVMAEGMDLHMLPYCRNAIASPRQVSAAVTFVHTCIQGVTSCTVW